MSGKVPGALGAGVEKPKLSTKLAAIDTSGTPTYDFSGLEDWTEESGIGKTIWVMAGTKGSGKTATAMELQYIHGGEMIIFSYDGKTQKIKHLRHRDNEHIHVFDVRHMFNHDPKQRVESGTKCVDMIMGKLQSLPDNGVDWIVHDYIDTLSTLTEMKARKINGKTARVPLSKWDPAWRDRKAFFEDIHSTSMKKAKYGIVYTGYVVREEILADGIVIATGARKPKWSGIVEVEADVVMLMDVEETILKNGIEHHRYAFIDSSKDEYPLDRKWYRLDDTEELKLFIEGKGIIVDRAPPKGITLPKVSKDEEKKEDENIVVKKDTQKPVTPVAPIAKPLV